MPIAAIASLIVFQTLLIFVHLAVYATLAAAFGIGGMVTKIIFIILAFSFVASSIVTRWYTSKPLDYFYALSAYWFGLVHFLFGGAVFFYFTLTILYHYNIYISPALVGGIFFGIFFLIHLYGTWNSGRGEITNIKVLLKSLPETWKGKKIVFLSDIHLGSVRGEKFLAGIVKKIEVITPEAVFIGGDIFDGTKCNEEKLIEPLRSLRTPKGVYFISGNHEYYLPDVEHAFAAIRNTGTKILHNEKIDIDGIDFVGVDYKSVSHSEDFKKVLDDVHIDHNKATIFIKHEPKDLEIAENAGISLGFFGHTHQGQIWPLSLLTKQIYKGFDYGLKPHGLMQVYTSSGVGTWGPPLRLGTRSEIVVVEFN